jgi:hypothetical protein
MAYIRKTKDVHISPKLLDVLNRISSKSEVAKQLLKTKISKDNLVDDPVDYLSVSKEDPSKISYAYHEKLNKVHPDEYWTFKGRVHAKPAAAIKKILKDVTEKDLDLFTSLYKAATAHKDFLFDIVSGNDIKKYYHINSYKKGDGTLTNSCMKHDHCQNLFDLYIKNPEVCQMLIMTDNDGLLLGRALLWNAVDVETGIEKKVMDRIYCIDDSKNVHYFKEWADDNGYIARRSQKWTDCLYFESYGKVFKANLSIKINEQIFTKYPYVDTFKFWDEKTSILSNFLPNDNGYIRTLLGSDGRTYSYDWLELDEYNDIYDQRDKIITMDYEINGINRLRISSDYLFYSECMDRYILQAHGKRDDELRDYIFTGEWEHLNDNNLIENRRKSYSSKKMLKENYFDVVVEDTIGYRDYIQDIPQFDANDLVEVAPTHEITESTTPNDSPAIEVEATEVTNSYRITLTEDELNSIVSAMTRVRGMGTTEAITQYVDTLRQVRFSSRGTENSVSDVTEETTTQSETPTEILDETANTDNLFEDL